MWLVSDVFTINIISAFFGLFFQADYSTDMLLHLNIEIVEKKINAQSFEFAKVPVEAANAIAQDQFPNKFFLGAASSAYQIEGAHNVSDKGVSIWDYWTHENPDFIKDKSNGDVACNSFYKYENDIQLLKDLGANAYRFSLSWTRILPRGTSNYISREGIRYYNDLINKLILNGMTPVVTIHQFDLPHKLQLLGGWTNPKLIEYFENYARIVFTFFGDRVKYWITINDPLELCNMQLGDALRPIYNDSGIGNYLCGHNVLLAHAKTYKLYRNEFQWLQNGKVGISLGMRWFEPEDYTSPEDAEASEVSFQFANYWFVNPLLGEKGDYPDLMRLEVGLKSAMQLFRGSRLPSFSDEEVKLLKGSLDFLGLNFFTSYSVRSIRDEFRAPNATPSAEPVPDEASFESDMSAIWLPYDEAFGVFDVKNTAENFGKLLARLSNDYILPQVIITANGYPDFGEYYDVDRLIYHYDHMSELFLQMKSGLDIRGYFIWSLMDSFEWKDGYRKHYGLYKVQFNDENRPRKEKLSAKVIRNIYKSKKIPKQLTLKDL